jgi:DNA transposition AAA+ family ATPase
MRNVVAQVKNVQRLSEVTTALRSRSSGVPGIGVLWGETGYGKTTAGSWLATQTHAVYVRAVAMWTPFAMLCALMRELDAQPLTRAAAMIEWLVEKLASTGRPVFVDEADYVMGNLRLIETLRDLHDLSTTPLVLIGMKDFQQRASHRPQLAGRVAHWVEFAPADLEDARTLVDAVCEAGIADDLLAKMVRDTGGSMRGMAVAIQHIEELARRKRLDTVAVKDWGDRAMVFAQRAAAPRKGA